MINRNFQRWFVTVLGLSVALGLAACSKKAADTTTTSAQPPAPAAALTVTGVELGRAVGGDKRVTETVTTFAPNDVVYVSVHTAGSAPSAMLKSRWTYQDGQLIDETEQAIAPNGDEATEFHISKPDGLPPGNYKVEIFLDGVSVQSKDFEVK